MTVDDGGGEAASPRPVIGGAFGLLPEHPSISWHEPTAVDPTRAPEGRAVVRLQVLGVPRSPSGDAAGTRYGTDGWDAATAEAFADRVLAEAELHVPGLAVRVVLVGGALQ